MYNIYMNSTGQPNKGNFNQLFSNQPLYFGKGSKIALNNLLVYNAIDNVSDEGVLDNNVIYIMCNAARNSQERTGFPVTPETYETGFNQFLPTADPQDTEDEDGFVNAINGDQFKDRPFFGNIKIKEYEGTYPRRVYKITLENGVYDPYAIDQYIAQRLGFDIDADILHDVKETAERHFIISDDATYGKIKIDIKKWNYNGVDDIAYRYDIVFPTQKYDIARLKSKSCISNLLGIWHDDMKTVSLEGGEEYWSFNETRKTHTSRDDPYAFKRGDFNNGILSLEVRLRPGIFDGGYDALSHDSDVIAGFNLTAAVGDSQAMAPENLTWLDITQTDRFINNLQVVITDQDGVVRGANIKENVSLTLTVKTPED